MCDFINASLGKNLQQLIKVNGNIIQQIRVAYHKSPEQKVRVVLDLVAGKGYEMEQKLLTGETQYILIFRPSKIP